MALTVADYNYIVEILSCVKALTQSLDILQGDSILLYDLSCITMLTIKI